MRWTTRASIAALIVGGSLQQPSSAQDAPAGRGSAMSKAELTVRTQAGRAAEKFLALVDAGKYSESYDAASAYFRKGITRRKWVDALGAGRQTLGKVRLRKLDRVELRATVTPDMANQAWIYSKTQFEEGEPCAELTIVSVEEGRWKMTGYFVGDPATFPKPPASR